MDLSTSNDSIPVASPCVDKCNPSTPDVEDLVIDIRDASPARTTRSQPLSPALKGAEEEAELPSASTQDAEPYYCDLERRNGGGPCNRSFDRQYNLNKHQMGEVHVQPMPCPFCAPAGRLRLRQALLNHVKKHHPTQIWTVFRCQLCPDTPEHSFSRSLVSHIAWNHSEVPLEARWRATQGF